MFQDGPKIKGSRGAEKGWKASSGFEAPAVVGADANYYNRALWKIIPRGGDKYLIENLETKRYLFQDGPAIKGLVEQKRGGRLVQASKHLLLSELMPTTTIEPSG